MVEQEGEDSSAVMDALTKFIYSHDDEYSPIKTRAILCHIYYHAIHDRWFQARDLMMMSHLQEGIQLADVPTQVPSLLTEFSLFLFVNRYCITELWFNWACVHSAMV